MRRSDWWMLDRLGALSFAAIASLITLFNSCAKTEGVDLLPGFRSYSTPTDTASMIRGRGYSLRVVEQQSNKPEDPRPPLSIARWVVDDYKLLSFRGSLEIEFMNDRLMRLAYYPQQVDEFNREAISQGWAKADGADVVRNAGRVRTRRATDYSGRFYFAFEDTKLVDEYEDWIRRYSKGAPNQAIARLFGRPPAQEF
jgi:hypothetical protein